MEKSKGKIASVFGAAGKFFRDFAEAVMKGDAFVKLSLFWMGAGYFRRKQYAKALLMTVFEIAVLLFTVTFASQYVPKFGTLGTVKQEAVFNMETMKKEFNDYDNSFKILLFSLVSFVVWITFLVVYIWNIKKQYTLQKLAERGGHINTFLEDLNQYRNKKFYVTLLAFPMIGVILFTVIPLLVMILVAFTNYDQQHMPPSELFT